MFLFTINLIIGTLAIIILTVVMLAIFGVHDYDFAYNDDDDEDFFYVSEYDCD